MVCVVSWDSSINWARGWMSEEPGFDSCQWKREAFFSPAWHPDHLWGSPSLRGCLPGHKVAKVWSWRQTSASAKVKNGGALATLPHVPSGWSAQLINASALAFVCCMVPHFLTYRHAPCTVSTCAVVHTNCSPTKSFIHITCILLYT
jgi:hypothetical protein